jgi:molybdenum cofactor biosynthesis enzyme MoaA
MGCLDHPDTKFKHWSANIHFSGPCNLKCTYCIGQFMPHLNGYNTLHVPPGLLPGIDNFLHKVRKRNIKEITLTGTNTDPALYHNLSVLTEWLREEIGEDLKIGIVTNGQESIPVCRPVSQAPMFDRVVVSVPSFDSDIYSEVQGGGSMGEYMFERAYAWRPGLEVNILLLPQVLPGLWKTIAPLISGQAPIRPTTVQHGQDRRDLLGCLPGPNPDGQSVR